MAFTVAAISPLHPHPTLTLTRPSPPLQLYLTGHDHNLEHLDRGFYSVVVTGK